MVPVSYDFQLQLTIFTLVVKVLRPDHVLQILLVRIRACDLQGGSLSSHDTPLYLLLQFQL